MVASCNWWWNTNTKPVSGHFAYRAETAGTDQAPVRLRCGDRLRLPQAVRSGKEIKLNIEANHATLAGHSFHHEIATAIALGLFGSVDANRGDAQLGWDTDQFPNSVEENALVMYEILKAGGFTTGGLNFDAKVRRQSTDKYDLFYGHIGAMDTMALSLKIAARMIEDGGLDQRVAKRYAGWNGELGQQILKGQMTLTEIAQYAEQHNPRRCTRAVIRNCWKIW